MGGIPLAAALAVARADYGAGRADQHDGSETKQESYQGVTPQR
jgi:hypothetical protein